MYAVQKKAFPVDHILEVLYCYEGIYFFCSEECSDKWPLPVSQQKESEEQQQSSI
jgi:hypothetical protein